jgi:hypothetical protein
MKNPLWTIFVFVLTYLSSSFFTKDFFDTNKLIYAIEINGTLCGFSEIHRTEEKENKIAPKQRVFPILWALGSQFEQELLCTCYLDESGNRASFFSDPSVKKRLSATSPDSTISAKTNKSDGDFQGITIIKVKVEAHPARRKIADQSLNIPGQSFDGIEDQKHIQGVFEIEHPRFDKNQALSFPPDFRLDKPMEEYLSSDEFIYGTNVEFELLKRQ